MKSPSKDIRHESGRNVPCVFIFSCVFFSEMQEHTFVIYCNRTDALCKGDLRLSSNGHTLVFDQGITIQARNTFSDYCPKILTFVPKRSIIRIDRSWRDFHEEEEHYKPNTVPL